MASGLGWTEAYRAVHAANQALVSLGRLRVGAQSKSSLGLRRGEPMATLPSPDLSPIPALLPASPRRCPLQTGRQLCSGKCSYLRGHSVSRLMWHL